VGRKAGDDWKAMWSAGCGLCGTARAVVRGMVQGGHKVSK
jgi:hypothetical protein